MSDHLDLKNATKRESFLYALLNKVIKEYKTLLQLYKRKKQFRIVEILVLSDIPGETQFLIQIINKSCYFKLTAAKIIADSYNLNDFYDFHAEMIRQAAQGKLIQFLKLSEAVPNYRIVSKKFDRASNEYIYTIADNESNQFVRSATELSKDKNVLANMGVYDIYDVGFVQGAESIIKEKTALLLAKKNYKNEGALK